MRRAGGFGPSGVQTGEGPEGCSISRYSASELLLWRSDGQGLAVGHRSQSPAVASLAKEWRRGTEESTGISRRSVRGLAVAARGHRAVPRVRGGSRETGDADLTLSSRTFREAAEEAGLSRLDGGIHFTEGNLAGQELGRRVGSRAWARAQAYIRGREDDGRDE